MAISFSCAQCGKKLKAPDSAAGKSSKCPGCGGPVTCPEPVYDAELLESTDEVDPYGDLDADKPYGVAGAAATGATATATEERRPCPMCGEMIMTTAAKCRFCGEVFDSTIKKLKKKGKGGKAKLASIASSQRTLIICIFLQICLYIGLLATSQGNNPQSGVAILSLCLALAMMVAGITATVFAFKLAIQIHNTGMGILLGILTLVPCIGLIVLLTINNSATRLLRDKGHHVGFLGADMSEF
jgi:predicted RNA-binding Zn-ribbon protein involved in translation (DUF1610 family)